MFVSSTLKSPCLGCGDCFKSTTQNVCDEGHAKQDQVGSPDYTCIAWSSSQYHQWQEVPCSNLHKQPNMVQACLHNSTEGKQRAWFSTKEPQWLQLQSQSSYLHHHGQTHPAVCSLYLRPISPEGHPATWTGSTQGCQIHIQELLWQNTTARLRLGKREGKQAGLPCCTRLTRGLLASTDSNTWSTQSP